MAEQKQFWNAYMELGPAGSPERDAATPKYVSDTRDWADRVESVLVDNPDADGFFRRSLQRFIDDHKLVAADLAAGPFQSYDQKIWDDSLSAYAGPRSICYDLGIRW